MRMKKVRSNICSTRQITVRHTWISNEHLLDITKACKKKKNKGHIDTSHIKHSTQ